MDCAVHYDSAVKKPPIKCMECIPSHNPLYGESVEQDMAMGNTCKRAKEKKEIEVKKIEVDGTTYYYHATVTDKQIDEILLYHYRDDLGEYAMLSKTDKSYDSVYKAALKDATPAKWWQIF